ncbi:hypothetical protein [Mycetohabitans sp. B46]|uniref:hypothetical protein n=1 Tax=Mycetohabitans sp. B46 TaxID=2772536 RepID=UPI00307ECF99
MVHTTAVLAIVLFGERLASYYVVGGVAAVLGVLVCAETRRRSVREGVVARSLIFQNVHDLRDADDARLRAQRLAYVGA